MCMRNLRRCQVMVHGAPYHFFTLLPKPAHAQFNLMACIEDRRQKCRRELAQQQHLQVRAGPGAVRRAAAGLGCMPCLQAIQRTTAAPCPSSPGRSAFAPSWATARHRPRRRRTQRAAQQQPRCRCRTTLTRWRRGWLRASQRWTGGRLTGWMPTTLAAARPWPACHGRNVHTRPAAASAPRCRPGS